MGKSIFPRPTPPPGGAPRTWSLPAPPPASPATAGEALSAISAGLRYLATADPASWTTAEQAGCLRALEQAASMHTAARSRVLAAFAARGGYEDDGHGPPPSWLRGQTRGTTPAAYPAIGGMRPPAPPPPPGRPRGRRGGARARGPRGPRRARPRP